MRALRLAVMVVVLACALAPAARASVGPPVRIELDRPAGPAEGGRVWKGRFRLTAARSVDISDVKVESPGWTQVVLDTGTLRALAAGASAEVAFEGVPATDDAPLTFALSASGRPVRQTFVLSRAAWERATTPAPDRELAPSAGRERWSDSAAGPRPVPTADPAPAAGATLRRETITRSAAARTITVRGRIVFTDPDGNERPVDGATVRAYDEDLISWQLGPAVATGSDGRFSITFTWDPCPVVCDQNPDIYLEYEAANSKVHVHPPIGFNFKWRTGTRYDQTSDDVNFGDRTPVNESEHATLFMLTTVTRGWRWFRERASAYDPPDVGVMWLDPTIPGGALYLLGDIHLGEGRDTEATVLHEYGHHWVANYAGFNQIPDYCNDICDDGFGLCGHCAYCEENGSTALQEGFPNWLSQVILRSFPIRYGQSPLTLLEFETNQPCGDIQGDPCPCNPLETEGFFSALLRDLEDGSANVSDPLQERSGPSPAAGDELFDGHATILEVMDEDHPATPVEFFNGYLARRSDRKSQLWATAKFNTYEFDTQNPGLVSNLASSSHTVNVSSGDHTIEAHWTPATDDLSGIAFYLVTFTQNSPCRPGVSPTGCPGWLGPDTVAALPAPGTVSPILPTGNWYVNVLAVDRSGRRGTNHRSLGPFVLHPPEPANLTAALPSGWAHEVVPRPTNDANLFSCPDPTSLSALTNGTYLNVSGENNGDQTVSQGFQTTFLVDGVAKLTVGSMPIPPGGFTGTNLGPVTVSAGRHTLEAFFDSQEAVAETSEVDNRIAYQWVWPPSAVNAPVTQLRGAPPPPTGGWSAVPTGTFFNCDGVRFNTPTADWFVATAFALDDTTDYDCRVHVASTGPANGFATNGGYSSRGRGCTDAVLVNRNVATGSAYDIGVLNQNASTASYRLSFLRATDFTNGDSLARAFAANTALQALQFTVVTAGWHTLDLRHVSGAWPLHLRLFSRTLSTADLDDDVAEIVVDSLDRGYLSANLTAGEYGVLVFRDPKDGLGPATYALEIGPTPPDFAPTTPASWAGSLVPRPAADGTTSSVPLPDTLHGNLASTYYNLAARNTSPVASPAWTTQVLLDGAVSTTIGLSALPGLTGITFNSGIGRFVRGGRHTLTSRLDATASVEELSETNNAAGAQWVWSPLVLNPNTVVSRTAPPDRTGGWSDAGAGAFWFNADGLRFAAPASDRWAGVAVMPGVGSDYDLRLHETARGATSGFAASLAFSGWDTGQSDYLLLNYSRTSRRAFDVGVLQMSGTDNYTAEAQTSSLLASDPHGTYGPFTLSLTHLFRLHEVRLVPGRLYRFTLTPTSGTVDLGLSLHRGDLAYQSKATAMAAAWTAPAGTAESFLVSAPDTGTYCLVVWKAGAADAGVTANYQLDIAAGNVDTPVAATPGSTRLAAPFPNPAAGETSVAFELASAAVVDLAIHDVQGARVRTLRSGTTGAGRHQLRWDRRDDQGRPVTTGVYWVRFRAGGITQARKLVLLQ